MHSRIDMKNREVFLDFFLFGGWSFPSRNCSIVLDLATLDTAGLVVLLEVFGECLEWWWSQWFVLPQLRGQEIVGTADGLESGLGEVAQG